jgi:hypothetical protein
MILPNCRCTSSDSLTPQTLLPACQQTWQLTRAALPPEHVSRWAVNRVVQPHGTRRTVLLWRVWDKRLRSYGLDPWYCCWCLNYDPENFYNHRTHWQLHLYANTVRVYRENARVRALLMQRLPEVCPPDFEFRPLERSVELSWWFTLPGGLADLPTEVAPRLAAALMATASVFDELFALLDRAPTPEERRQTQARRKRIHAPQANPAAPAHSGALRRDISPSLRRQVLARHAHRCGICGRPFRKNEEIHIDHIVPWSQGGLTVLENLQPSHAHCNLRKSGGSPSRPC